MSWCRNAPYIRNEQDLTQVIEEARRRILLLNLYEYFAIRPIKINDIKQANEVPQNEYESFLKKLNALKTRGKTSDDFEFFERFLIKGLGEGPTTG